jgi:hypothetical protein
MLSLCDLKVWSIIGMFSAATLIPCKGLISDCAAPIIIDNYKVKDVTLDAAIEAVRVKTGVNIILKGVPPEKRLKKVSLDLHDVPLTFIIESLCKLSDRAYAWVASKYGVAINQKIALYKLP